ncbi:hypothetical protein, conserved [Babesia bigemina]|uniref:Uncharacterized protein n=1 Tax=Babesia bigemina TaxID=5866 RepID=A0A061D2P7_BABBI|nr:hypothetical protein, conserved [Babesia bigemina]CDR95051.1 hypothetical protein, conserved [Babesia bigemina]|eukprot:XP_012767237.1 hypothetical protein, conserved [Babesia bigemina]
MEEDCEVCSCSSGEFESDSSCCSCETCSCDSESRCSCSSPSECSSCSCSPRNAAQPQEVKPNDLEQIKTFIADIAGLIRQSKEVAIKEPPAPEKVPEEPPKAEEPVVVVVEKAEPEEPPAPVAPVQTRDRELQQEIAELERIIHHSEAALRNGYEARPEQPVETPLGGHVPHFAASPCSTGAATAVESPAYYCYTNDHTVGDPFSCAESPISCSAQRTWRSGFEAPAAGEEHCFCDESEAESDTDYSQLDLDQLHAKMVSLDLISYMKLVESVLDERVRLAIAQQGAEELPH